MALSTSKLAVADRGIPVGGQQAVENWLWFIAMLVFAMIVVGGATRLTDSGLSITEWKPILGAIPPLNEADWLSVFEKYKQIPEYHLVNKGMALDEFKFIFWWEWSHRFLGRMIGIAFALPLMAFWAMGRLRAGTPLKLASVLALGGLQGAIGWYMVSSGLSERVDVSQYRLALHLSVAMAIFAVVIWFALDERRARLGSSYARADQAVRSFAHVLLALIAVQIVLGAFVAGLRAGLVYNTWPSMNGQFVPSDYWIGEHGWLSLFDSHAAVQFNHRMAAYVVLTAALYHGLTILRGGASGVVRTSGFALAAAVAAQAVIGILTLVMHVPLVLGLLHQGGAAIVLGIAIWHLFVCVDAASLPGPRTMRKTA
ncbi:MAG TPA: COX15/CtaA family protein [Hyphomicrobium sp.]|nr:COX15/CtaA family protein [Hyphomicrobium sp.]